MQIDNLTARPIDYVLDLARWAPSGDNGQPWRFEILNDKQVKIHFFDERNQSVYDLDGHPSQLSFGVFLETFEIAANAQGYRVDLTRNTDSQDSEPIYIASLTLDESIKPNELWQYIKTRAVNRFPYHTTPLSKHQKVLLQKSLGDSYALKWLESPSQRWQIAKLLFQNSKLRLILPEAYKVHQRIIAWNACFSDDKVPDQALGLDRITIVLMQWVMKSWHRAKFFNTYLLGHLTPRLQMDLRTGYFCAAHFIMLTKKPLVTIDDYILTGRALQRFWLTASSLNLQMQPEITPIVFGRYVREGRAFSNSTTCIQLAKKCYAKFCILFGNDADLIAFMGRIGEGNSVTSRSLRLPIEKLLK